VCRGAALAGAGEEGVEVEGEVGREGEGVRGVPAPVEEAVRGRRVRGRREAGWGEEVAEGMAGGRERRGGGRAKRSASSRDESLLNEKEREEEGETHEIAQPSFQVHWILSSCWTSSRKETRRRERWKEGKERRLETGTRGSLVGRKERIARRWERIDLLESTAKRRKDATKRMISFDPNR